MDRSVWANKTFLCVVEIFLESFQYPEKIKIFLFDLFSVFLYYTVLSSLNLKLRLQYVILVQLPY